MKLKHTFPTSSYTVDNFQYDVKQEVKNDKRQQQSWHPWFSDLPWHWQIEASKYHEHWNSVTICVMRTGKFIFSMYVLVLNMTSWNTKQELPFIFFFFDLHKDAMGSTLDTEIYIIATQDLPPRTNPKVPTNQWAQLNKGRLFALGSGRNRAMMGCN